MLKALKINQTWNGHPIPTHEQITLELEWRKNGLLIDFAAPFYDDPAPETEMGSLDGLWDYEVVEVFIAHGERYTELEMGPHGHYLLLCLQGIRQRLSAGHRLRYKHYRSPGQWGATALVPWHYLPPEPWTVNAYAIHGQGASRRYLAATAVPGEQPDFHRLQYFQHFSFT